MVLHMDNTQSFLHPDTEERINDSDNATNVNDLILALEKFKAEHGDKARVSFFHQDEDGEIHPYQFIDVNDGFYDYDKGDVCSIELTQ